MPRALASRFGRGVLSARGSHGGALPQPPVHLAKPSAKAQRRPREAVQPGVRRRKVGGPAENWSPAERASWVCAAGGRDRGGPTGHRYAGRPRPGVWHSGGRCSAARVGEKAREVRIGLLPASQRGLQAAGGDLAPAPGGGGAQATLRRLELAVSMATRPELLNCFTTVESQTWSPPDPRSGG